MADAVLSAPHFHNEEAAFEYVEALLWPEGPKCPHCGNWDADKIGKLTGKSSRVGLRKCYACRETFTVRKGTIFEDSHLALHLWLQAIHLMSSSKKGISTRQMQRLLLCSMKTAWFLTHRIREIMAPVVTGEPMGGAGKVVEADETFVGGKEKNKHSHKRIRKNQGNWGKEVVFSLVERGGKVRSHHTPSVTAATLRPILKEQLHADTHLMTDDAGQYRHMHKDFEHSIVQHTTGEYVRGPAHTNTIEGYFSILKRGIIGVYHHVSPEHLKRYLGEFDFRYNEREALGVNDVERTKRAVVGAQGKRLTYERTRRPKPQEPANPEA